MWRIMQKPGSMDETQYLSFWIDQVCLTNVIMKQLSTARSMETHTEHANGTSGMGSRGTHVAPKCAEVA